MEVSLKSEDVTYDPIEEENKKTSHLRSAGNVSTRNTQAIQTAHTTWYHSLTFHDDYRTGNDAVRGGTTLKNVERANNADDEAVRTMRQHEVLKYCKQNESLKWNDEIYAVKAKCAEPARIECANATNQSINRYDTSREGFISLRIFHTALIAHTARMRRLEMSFLNGNEDVVCTDT